MLPFLEKSGGTSLFLGKGGSYLGGHAEERWDVGLPVRQRSAADFI
jgi:hypothetical protein